MWQSGQLTVFGLGIWGAHSHDALVHLALIESFSKNLFSFKNPNLLNVNLQNYHFFYDYFLAVLHVITQIPSILLFFVFVPTLTSVLIGIFSIILLKRLNFTSAAIAVSLLTIYLAGSLGFIPSLLMGQSFFGGESLFWMTQSVTTLVNPPFAFSLVILLGFLILLDKWFERLNWQRFLILSLLAGVLIQTKAYASALLLTSLSIVTFKAFVTRNKSLKALLILLVISVLFTLVFFLPTYHQGGSLFVISPFWFIHSLFAAQDRLDLNRFANAWQAYLVNGNYPKLLLLHVVGLFIFFIGNLGIRIFSFPKLISSFKDKLVLQLIAWITLIGLVLPLIVVQTGNSWNSIQFSYYSLFFLGLLTGPVVVALLSRCRNLFQLVVCIGLLLLFSIPTTIGSLQNYTSSIPSTYVPYPELRLLERLSHEDGLVLVPFYQQAKSRPLTPPKPLFAFDSTSYITALSGLPTYFADDVNLSIMNYDYSQQKTDVQRFYQTTDQSFAYDFLTKNPIKYIYVDPFSVPKVDLETLGFKLFFDDGQYKLYTKAK
jgi:hypothetical protein